MLKPGPWASPAPVCEPVSLSGSKTDSSTENAEAAEDAGLELLPWAQLPARV